jgi:hypothetical protein
MIDPRSRLIEQVKNHFGRIFQHGGIFLIFADRRESPRVIWGHYQSYSGRIEKERDIYCDNWGLLSILDSLVVEPDHGEEMSVVQKEFSLGQTLLEHAQGGASCALYVRQNG